MERYKPVLNRYLQNETRLSTLEIERALTFFQLEILKAEELFQQAQTDVKRVGFIVEGYLRVYSVNAEGNERVHYFLRPNTFFSEMEGFFYGKKAFSNIQAVTPCVIVYLYIEDLEQIIKEIPAIEMEIKLIGERALIDIYKSQAFLREGTSVLQYKYLLDNYPDMMKLVPKKYIASFLGITQSSLSRVRRKLFLDDEDFNEIDPDRIEIQKN
jgi:CRP-like cAMP-binding protein